MRIEKDFKEFLELLNEKEVKYLIVGGFAYSFYAQPRYTKDIDIFISSSPENATKMVEVIEDFGFKSFGLTVDDFSKEHSIIQLGYPPVRIDIITSVSGVDFDSAWANKVQGKYGEITVYFISLSELIKNKRTTGRDQDLVDVKYLERLKKSKSP